MPETELEASAGDKKLKIRGSDTLLVLGGIVISVGLALNGYMLWDHKAEAGETVKEVAKSLEKSNAEVAKTLEKSNKAVVDALTNLANEQRRATEAIKEGNCLNSLPQDRRVNAADICKRTSRDFR